MKKILALVLVLMLAVSAAAIPCNWARALIWDTFIIPECPNSYK